jgi:alpha-D-ribose 1-methylphosphonate 5-phosphate C-P lyase
MAKPRKSRRLGGSVAVFGVFNILFSQRHDVVTRRLALAICTPGFAVAFGGGAMHVGGGGGAMHASP